MATMAVSSGKIFTSDKNFRRGATRAEESIYGPSKMPEIQESAHVASGAESDRLSAQVLIDIDQLSTLWRVPRGTLYNWVSQGRLPHIKLGRLLRFDMDAIETFRRRSTMEYGSKR